MSSPPPWFCTSVHGATEVELHGLDSPDATIAIQLNSELVAATVKHAIKVKANGVDVAHLDAVMAVDDQATVKITVPGGFQAETEYTVTIAGGAGGIKDRYDDALAKDYTITWTTAPEAP